MFFLLLLISLSASGQQVTQGPSLGRVSQQGAEPHCLSNAELPTGSTEDAITATFSIVAVDPQTGVCGAAVASKYPAVGKVVPYVRAGVGAFCTQHHHVPRWGEQALDLLAAGKRPEAVFLELLEPPGSLVDIEI